MKGSKSLTITHHPQRKGELAIRATGGVTEKGEKSFPLLCWLVSHLGMNRQEKKLLIRP